MSVALPEACVFTSDWLMEQAFGSNKEGKIYWKVQHTLNIHNQDLFITQSFITSTFTQQVQYDRVLRYKMRPLMSRLSMWSKW